MRIGSIFALFLFTFLAGIPGSANGQQKLGVPFIQNFPPSTYNQGTQNFVILQGKSGILFVGNNNGVLTYDGHRWKLIEISNKSEVHALAEDKNGRIYVGAQGEFGYLQQKNSIDQFEYVSLLSLLPAEHRNFNDVWNIYCTDQGVIFRSTAGIYTYHNNQISTIRLSTSSHRSFYIYNELLVRENNFGLRKLVGDSFKEMPEGDKFLNEPIHSILPYPGHRYLVVTQYQGLYLYDNQHFTPFPTEADELIKGQNVYGRLMPDSTFALCTRSNGLVVIDTQGRIVYHLDKSQGLVNESIWDVWVDLFSKNLWIATNNGISFVEIQSPFYAFQNPSGISGQIYHMSHHGNKVYAASSLGVYTMDLQSRNQSFGLLPEIQTQTWHFYQDSTALLAATNTGIYEIRNNKAYNIGFGGRSWFFLQLKKRGQVFVNTAEGFVILEKKSGKFVVKNIIPRFAESIYYFTEDASGNLWADSPIKGMFKIQLPQDGAPSVRYTLYNKSKGFPSDYKLKPFEYNGDVRFSTSKGIYRYDERLDSMLSDQELNRKIFGNHLPEVEWIEQDDYKNLWFVIKKGNRGNMVSLGGYALFHGDSVTVNTDIFWRVHHLKIRDFMSIDRDNVLIGTSDGILSLQPRKAVPQNFPVHLTDLSLTQTDSSVLSPDLKNLVLPYHENSIRIHYAGMNFTGIPHTYETFLEGFDDRWQPSTATSKEYTNLPAGKFTFRVRAKNAYNKPSDELAIAIKVQRPWFATSWAYVLYVLGLAGLVYAIMHFRSQSLVLKNVRLERMISKRTSELQQKHDDLIKANTLLESQKEEIESQKADIEQKNRELVSAKNIIDKQNTELRTINSNLEAAVNERTQELQLAYRNLLQTKEELDTFIYRSSHDIKGPLLRILGLCHVALLDVKDDVAYGYFKKLEKEITLTSKMLHKLIVVQNVKNVPLALSTFNLQPFVNMVVEKLSGDEGYPAVTFHIDNSLQHDIKTDQYLLEVTLQNIVENAIAYRRNSGAEVKIKLERVGGKNRIIVIDNGKGISEEVSSQIFDMFYRGSETSLGAGLGLYIAKKALQRLQGDIKYIPGESTTFVMELP